MQPALLVGLARQALALHTPEDLERLVLDKIHAAIRDVLYHDEKAEIEKILHGDPEASGAPLGIFRN